MKVSVIIPVYNAAHFVTKAVESALAQPETDEVVLIEDSSPDGSLAVCQALAEQHAKVRLLRHPGGENRGAAASRNLGIQHAQYDYISFLDADDYYLPGRFSAARQIFEADQTCEGVYDAMGIHFEDDQAKKQWCNSSMGKTVMTTMTEIVTPGELFDRLVDGDAGYFSICALVIKKAVFNKTGYMNEALGIYEDTNLIWRLASVASLRPGCLDQPVVMRRVHGHNRVSATRSERALYQARMKMWWATYQWFEERGLKVKKQVLYCALLNYAALFKPLSCQWMTRIPTVSGQPSFIGQLVRLSLLPFETPKVILTGGYWKLILSIIYLAVKRNLRRLI